MRRLTAHTPKDTNGNFAQSVIPDILNRGSSVFAFFHPKEKDAGFLRSQE